VKLMSNEIHASENALDGYCYFFRWLTYFAKKYPQLVTQTNEKIKKFIESEEYRIKSVVPNLGEFLPLISLNYINYHWKDIANAYLSECYDRNVFWMLQKFPHLKDISENSKADERRLEESFELTLISKRLLLFHIYFIEHIARPKGKTGDEIIDLYDSNLGKPTQEIRQNWQNAVKEILDVSTWEEYFSRLSIPMPDSANLLTWLKNCIANSERKGYHNNQLLSNQGRNSHHSRNGNFNGKNGNQPNHKNSHNNQQRNYTNNHNSHHKTNNNPSDSPKKNDCREKKK